MSKKTYRIDNDGKYHFYTWEEDNTYNQKVWLENDGRFELKEDGGYYTYYNEDGTANLEKEALELEKEDKANKWQIVNDYLVNEIPNIENTSASRTTHTFIVTLGNIEEIEKITSNDSISEDHEIKWFQVGIPTFTTTKEELRIVYLKWFNLKQAKINEVFGTGV